MLIYAHALLKSSTPRALGWTWCLTLCAFPIGQPQGSSRKKNISEKVAEVRRERAVRVKNHGPVSARQKRRENTAGVIGCKRAEKKKGIKEERLLGDPPDFSPWFGSPPDSLHLADRPVTHVWAHTHRYTGTATSHFTRPSLMLQQMNMYEKKTPSTLSFQLSRCVCTRGPSWLHHWNEIQRIKKSVTISC